MYILLSSIQSSININNSITYNIITYTVYCIQYSTIYLRQYTTAVVSIIQRQHVVLDNTITSTNKLQYMIARISFFCTELTVNVQRLNQDERKLVQVSI